VPKVIEKNQILEFISEGLFICQETEVFAYVQDRVLKTCVETNFVCVISALNILEALLKVNHLPRIL
jgi:hypothetical protein